MLKQVKASLTSSHTQHIYAINKLLHTTLKKLPTWYAVLYALSLLIQGLVWYLIEIEYLALGYGWEGRMRKHVFLVTIGIQFFLGLLAIQASRKTRTKSYFQAHYVLLAVMGIWFFLSLEIHYKWR